MKFIKLFSVFILAFIVLNCSNEKKQTKIAVNKNSTKKMSSKPANQTLFERLGKEEGISNIVDDIFDLHLKNPTINHLFIPLTKNPEHVADVKSHTKEFLSAGTGGGAVYTGKDLPTAHKGLQITEKEFLSATDDILTVLSNHKIDEETKKDMLYILYSLKINVIRK